MYRFIIQNCNHDSDCYENYKYPTELEKAQVCCAKFDIIKLDRTAPGYKKAETAASLQEPKSKLPTVGFTIKRCEMNYPATFVNSSKYHNRLTELELKILRDNEGDYKTLMGTGGVTWR